MEGIIFDIKHYAVHDGPGIRQTIFFKGCPLSCWWCHNPESQKKAKEYYTKKNKLNGKTFSKKETIGYQIKSSELLKIIEQDTLFFEESEGGVTFSGGEPLMQPDFLYDLAMKTQMNHIHTALDTCGYAPQDDILSVIPYINLWLFDLKIIDEITHKKYTGVSNKLILENLEFLDQTQQDIILRFPIIPGITNTESNIEQVTQYLKKLKNTHRIDILPYHNISKSKYQRFRKENKMENVEAKGLNKETIQKKFETIGFTVKIGG